MTMLALNIGGCDNSDSSANPIPMAALQTFDESEMGRGADILVESERVFVGDRRMAPHIIVYDTRGRLIQRFGPHGHGPGELFDPTALSRTPDGRLAVFDMSGQAIHVFGETGGSYQYERTQRLNKPATQVIMAGHVIAAALMGGALLLMPYDSVETGSDARTVGEPPWERPGVSVPVEVQRAYAAMDPNGQRIAIVYLGHPEVQLVPLSGEPVTTISRREVAPEPGDGGYVRFYRDVYATRRRVYALYCGCADPELLSRAVHVFRWDGELEMVLDLGGAQVYSIAVSADDRVLYGSVDDPEPVIRTWAIPG
jgi:hypothetical protein